MPPYAHPVLGSLGPRRQLTRVLQVAALLAGVFAANWPVPAVAAPFAYVADRGSNTVSVVDTATNVVVATISVGKSPQAVAVNPDGSAAYVANFGVIPERGTVSVIDTTTRTVTADIPVGLGPAGIAISRNGAFAYVTNLDSHLALDGPSAADISVIDTGARAVVATIGDGDSPLAIAIVPNGGFAYVTYPVSVGEGAISVIDTGTNTVSRVIPGGWGPSGVAITPDGKRAYVTNCFQHEPELPPVDAVSVIDTASDAVVTTIAFAPESCPAGIAISPNGALAYVANEGVGTVSVIDTTANTVTAHITVGATPYAVVFTPDGAFAYVTNSSSNDVSVIDTTSSKVTDTIPVGERPLGIAIAPARSSVPGETDRDGCSISPRHRTDLWPALLALAALLCCGSLRRA